MVLSFRSSISGFNLHAFAAKLRIITDRAVGYMIFVRYLLCVRVLDFLCGFAGLWQICGANGSFRAILFLIVGNSVRMVL